MAAIFVTWKHMISNEEFCLISSSEATVFSGIYWMHGWYDLCFYGASQLFPLCDLLSPSGMFLIKIFFLTPSMFVQILLYRKVICFSALGVQQQQQQHSLSVPSKLG